jgi:NADH-quinone oxidoreductase subunit I
MTLQKLVRRIFFIEILKGMALTISKLFTRPVTRQYPEEPRPSLPGFRGLHALVRESTTGREKCIACGLCAAVCPSQCITIHTSENEQGQKIAEEYVIDVLRCVFCAFCVEACPVGAVVLTEHYEYSGYNRADFVYNKQRLLENWDRYMAGEKGRTYIESFWKRPRLDYFKAYEGQAVFRPAASKESA